MEVKQVFYDYARHIQRPIDTYHFCPRCGTRSRLMATGRHRSLQCPRCGCVLYQNPSPGVVVLIVDNDRILLGERAHGVYMGGTWSLPGGFIEFDEDFLSAAHREILEETGLSINIISIISVVSNFHSAELHTLVIVLLAEKTSGELKPGDDMVKLEWFSLSGPLPPMAFDADRHIIERYHQAGMEGAPIDPRFATLENKGETL
jgi:8-oxo-dGTP diphosphatase